MRLSSPRTCGEYDYEDRGDNEPYIMPEVDVDFYEALNFNVSEYCWHASAHGKIFSYDTTGQGDKISLDHKPKVADHGAGFYSKS